MISCIDFKWSLFCVVILLSNSLVSDQLYAQSGLRKALEKLDTNKNGVIEPEEITPLARPYLERITRSRRMSLERPNEINRLQEAARVHAALINGVSGRDALPKGKNTLLPFGPEPGANLVPEFGLAELKYPYTQADLEEADRTMRRYDYNEDGYIDRAEASRSRWTHRNPFEMDLDKDNRLSRLELGQRYARRRLLSVATSQLTKDAWRAGNGNRSKRDDERRNSSQWWRRSGSRLTVSVLGRFDTNRNGRLELAEAQSLGIPSGRIDSDRDGELSREELHTFLTALQEEAGDATEGIPGWFYELDADRDGQISMSEFATEWTSAKLAEFKSVDRNNDGLLTLAEVSQSKAMVGGSYQNKNAEVLPPRRTIISEIEVDEDYIIGDLNVQLSITHSNTGSLDAYLTGPDGQRIELFTEIGGSGDNFDQTIFDDQSHYPITKTKAPFKGTFIPEGLLKKQPSLKHFNGKSVKGFWQLIIRGSRNQRFGMLHGWSLIVKPQDNVHGATVSAPLQDGPQPTTRTILPSDAGRRDDSRRSSSVESSYRLRSSDSKPNYSERRKSDGDDERSKIEASKKDLEKYREWVRKRKLGEKQYSKDKQYSKANKEAKKEYSKDKSRSREKELSKGKERPGRKKPREKK